MNALGNRKMQGIQGPQRVSAEALDTVPSDGFRSIS